MKTSFWTKLLDLLSPRQCAICSQRLAASESVLCAPCLLHLPYTGFHHSPLDNPMARLFWGHFPVERATALFYYEPKSDISRLIYDMKYNGRAETCVAMGCIAANSLAGTSFFDGIDAVIPMPVTRKRRWQRGYNQSELIADGISQAIGIPVYRHVVKRLHFHGSQTNKRQRERRDNVEDAFQLADGNKIAGKHLLLVDDIVTTGATITSCAKELCKSKGVKVSVLTLGFTKS